MALKRFNFQPISENPNVKLICCRSDEGTLINEYDLTRWRELTSFKGGVLFED
jgi:hypothetical protein